MKRSLLIIEDDLGLQNQLKWSFDAYEVRTADDRESAAEIVKKHRPAVITLDLGLPPDPGGVTEGFETLQAIQSISPHSKVIVITGNDQSNVAVQSIAQGAYDYYQKPIDPDMLALVIDRAFRLFDLEEENRKLQRLDVTNPLDGIIAVSPEMHAICRTVERVSGTDITTLILGESGTGKDVIARAIHRYSVRANQPFVAVNSAAIPENLLESELFGHEKGAFTGADRQVKGKVEMANGGTFFLDEIGDIPMSLQPKLLRFLQERVIERVGGRSEIPVDVRVICATHQNLAQLIKEGKFRHDLFYRINEITIQIPPLNERRGDVRVLANTFVQRYALEMKRNISGFTETALAAMEAYSWPGNVRELESRVKRAVLMSTTNQVTEQDLELENNGKAARSIIQPLREIRNTAERRAIVGALAEAGGNVSRAAELLEITRPTLYSLLNKFDLKV
ncbi:MAG TPA: PEP-CTERM-box response regulator transcription factor [Crenotrichaceae bacterium]|nr:PEP-CTERM-box response regulator transcription factor [Crenotrichaceae bacterium]